MPLALRKRVQLSAFCTAITSIEHSCLFAVPPKLAWSWLNLLGESAYKQFLIKLVLT
jgi:hypothetical protein